MPNFSRYLSAVRAFLRQTARDLAAFSRLNHCLAGTFITAFLFLLIAAGMVILPFRWKPAYFVFQWSCFFAFSLSATGTVAWMLEQQFRKGWRGWLMLGAILLSGAVSFAWPVLSVFYWAFDRGYFLD